ncbi:hypothetical protein VPNG_08547 [Cytospora leucostoma]|uniref:Fe2OG dioxygenase domain-containing protein n=1 Tax=Cytospora leucostoma TaxID=1230097 RepID=A0A423W566_9PEZI|nr:hypothetical protein VPNG_08547 [Cytospora leucostoma]
MSTSGPHAKRATFDPSKYPPFPKDIPTVKLDTFSFAELQQGDEALQDRLFHACKVRGFFYLALNGSDMSSMQRDCDDIARLSEKVFDLPEEEKEKFPMRGSLFGYKRLGATKTDAQGTPDSASFFNIAKDAIFDNTDRWPLPSIILQEKQLIRRHMANAHRIGMKIMSVLATKIGLPEDGFEPYHRLAEESGDHIRMTHGPPRATAHLPEIQTPGHTDFGTITILFNWLGGLQMWSESSRDSFDNVVDPDATAGSNSESEKPRWLWVEPPPPNHAIVNLGDAAVKFTGGLFCSGRHRVVPAPGEQGRFDRYSIVYFVRPEDKAVLRRLEAPGIPKTEALKEEDETTAKEWINKQAKGLGYSIAQ